MLFAKTARRGQVSAVREVPVEIPRPPYVDEDVVLDVRSGLPRRESVIFGSFCIVFKLKRAVLEDMAGVLTHE